MRKIGLSTFALQTKYGDERALEICAEAGFESVDFNMRKFDKSVDITDEEVIEFFSKISIYTYLLPSYSIE